MIYLASQVPVNYRISGECRQVVNLVARDSRVPPSATPKIEAIIPLHHRKPLRATSFDGAGAFTTLLHSAL